MAFRSLTIEEQFFNKPINITPVDLAKGGIVPEFLPTLNHPILLDTPLLFKGKEQSQFMNHLSKNWGWYVGFFIAGMIVGNYIINKNQEQQKKNNRLVYN
jgi:hypothetical protein